MDVGGKRERQWVGRHCLVDLYLWPLQAKGTWIALALKAMWIAYAIALFEN